MRALYKALPLLIGISVLLAVTPASAARPESDFGRLFPELPAFQPDDALLVGLALAMKDPNAPADDNPDGVPSGFTYLGQFLDHDLTLDTTPLGEASVDLSSMVNGRTARLDLDSMYGGGQLGSPELYTGAAFTIASPNGFPDFQRTETGKALVPEGRNDENMVIAQLHVAFQQFHNTLVAQGMSFAEARRTVCWHWQWLVVHEFLPHIVGQATVDAFMPAVGKGVRRPRFAPMHSHPSMQARPMMPVEFSVAAYRFGHSMVRLAYVMPTGSTTKTQVFNLSGNDLHGGRVIPLALRIDFNNFFDIPGQPVPPGRNISRKIDGLLSNSLFNLPIGPVIPPDPPAVVSLAERNLLRGKRLGLPSYQAVATAMGLEPLTNAQLDPTGTLGLSHPGWEDQAPLWFGLLKESEIATGGRLLGPTGGQIVAEVILGLIDADRTSYFHAPQPWEPAGGTFGIADLLLIGGSVQ